jgi:hypothetical protein
MPVTQFIGFSGNSNERSSRLLSSHCFGCLQKRICGLNPVARANAVFAVWGERHERANHSTATKPFRTDISNRLAVRNAEWLTISAA